MSKDTEDVQMQEKEGVTELAGQRCGSYLLHWKAGIELPPFVSSNTAAISALSALYEGTADVVPSLVVSEAVAVQIWRLIFDD